MLCPLSDRPFLSKQQTQQLFLCHLVLEHFHKFFLADIIVAQRLELWQIKKIGIVFHLFFYRIWLDVTLGYLPTVADRMPHCEADVVHRNLLPAKIGGETMSCVCR